MNPKYTPSENNVDAMTKAVFSAYEKLPDEEKERVQAMAKKVVAHVKRNNKMHRLSIEGAIEAIGKCAMELVKEQK